MIERTDSVGLLMRQLGRMPLLTPEEEITLGNQVKSMMLIIESKQRPSPEEESVIREGKRAKDRMIRSNLRLVISIAKKYQNRGLELADLINEGVIGIARGVEKFDPAKGYRFSTYAYWWVRQAITRALAEKSRSVRLPFHMVDKLNKIKVAQWKLSQELGRAPSFAEVGEMIGLSAVQVREIWEANLSPHSLDCMVGEDRSLGEILPDDRCDPEAYLEDCTNRATADHLLAQLDERERIVIRGRYGLDGFRSKPESLAAVAVKANVSRERVRQIQLRAEAKLRQYATAKKMFDH